MKILKSQIGWSLVGIYLVLSIISIIYSRICNQGICDVGYLLLPSIPWIAWLSGGMFNSTFIGILAYVVSILLNVIVIYLIGYVINLLIDKIKRNKRR